MLSWLDLNLFACAFIVFAFSTSKLWFLLSRSARTLGYFCPSYMIACSCKISFKCCLNWVSCFMNQITADSSRLLVGWWATCEHVEFIKNHWGISALHIWLLVLVKYLLNAAWTELVVLWTRLLQTAQGSLLDDEQLVNTLNSSKTTSQDVAEQLQVSEQTEIKIDAAREVIAFPFNEDLQSLFYSKLQTSCSLVL